MWGNCPVGGVCRNAGFGIQILIALVLCIETLHAQNCVPAPPGLVSWWRGDGNGSDAVGTNNSTFMNAISFSDGKVGQAFTFNGIDSQIRFGNTVGNFDTNDFTVEFWLRTAANRLESLIEKYPTCGPSSEWYIRINGGRLGAAMMSDALFSDHNVVVSQRSINDGLLQHVTFVRKVTNIAFYIDGALDASNNSAGGVTRIDNNIDLVAGRSVCVGVDGTYPYTGQLDEISVYNRALSASEIQAIYNAGNAGKCRSVPEPSCVPPALGLISWWKGDGDANDSLVRNNGTLNGNATFGAGIVGQAFNFDGMDDYISVAPSANLNVGAGSGLTIEGWIKPADLSVSRPLFEWDNSLGQSFGTHFWSSANSVSSVLPGALFANIVDTANNYHIVESAGGILNTNQFQHIALTYDKTTGVATIYYNGTVVATQNLGIFTPQTSGPLYLGERHDGEGAGKVFQGLMDEVAVYKRPLSGDEIAAIYRAGSAGKCPLASVGPFTNGSFESPALAPGFGQSLPSGSTAITGWRVEGLGIGWQNGAAFGVSPVDGAQHIGFNGGDAPPGQGTIAQTFTTTVGQTYSVSFNVGRTGSGSGTMSLLAEVTSSSDFVLGSLNAVAPDSPGYGPARTFTFTATTSISTLNFRDTSSVTVAVDPLLDNVSVVPVVTCVPPPSGLVSWWKGETDGSDAAGSNNSTVIDGLSFTSGKVGKAMSFNGTDSQIRFGNTIGNFDTNDFTIEFWIRTTAGRHESLIEKWPTCGASSEWYIRMDGGRLGAEMMSDTLFNDHTVVVSQRSINDGLFHHVAFLRQGTRVAFYIDGALDASSNSVGGVTKLNNNTDLVVGRSVCVGVDGTYPYTGQLDEISVYNRALSASEI